LLVVSVLAVTAFVTAPGVSAADTARPDTTITVPVNNASVPAGAFQVRGGASDDVAVKDVRVAVKNIATNLYLQANGTWGSFVWLPANVATPNALTTTWTFTYTAAPGSYGVSAVARDTSNKIDDSLPWVRYTVTNAPPVDSAPPDTTITAPANNASLPAGSVQIQGAATDDIAVQDVRVSIMNTATGLYLQGNGSWGAFAWLDATVASPNTASTAWSFSYTATPGNYTVSAIARDTSNKVDALLPWAAYTITETAPPTGKPNVVFVLTDDQRWDTLWAMPNVQSQLVAKGTSFTNTFAVDPLCCPSRASILSGTYSHTNGVYQNQGPDGPMQAFDDDSTVATWLDGAGYRTAMIGKYFNGYNTMAPAVPPGWDRWVAFDTEDVGGGMYYDYDLSIDGSTQHFGTNAASYSTDVLANQATSFIRSTPSTDPLFLYFAPYGPHEPATPAPRHASAFPNMTPFRPPSYNEADVSDKPAYIRNLPSFTTTNSNRIDGLRAKQYRTLLAVDDAVGAIVQALTETGRLDNTMIVFMSDNGFLWGEHRWGKTGAENKLVPYEESIRLPMVVRYDPVTGGTARTDTRMVLNMDVAPTFAQLAGTAAPGADGTSFVPLLQGAAAPWRSDFLVERGTTTVPAYCAVRSTNRLYVRYATGEEELYDLVADPYELVNRINDPAYAADRTALRSRRLTLCVPRPPGYTG
jgi:arylsulfatase A-like enzyme